MIFNFQTVFRPEFTNGGVDSLTRGTVARLFDDFEYASNGALQAVWTATGGAATPTRSTIANAIRGNYSMESAITVSTGTLYRAISNNTFHYPAPGRIRYVSFKATASVANSALRVRLSDASDANLYREWSFTVSSDTTRDIVIDLYSGGAGFQNTESYSGPAASGATAWDSTLIDRFEFRNLAVGATYRFDDIRFFYEYSLLDAIGFGTEPSTVDGADGSIHSKLRGIYTAVEQIVGSTDQFVKAGPGTAVIGNTYTFGLELIGSAGQGIPSTADIDPGNYTVDRLRSGVTTNIVASTAASEAAGLIYVSYQPTAANWLQGDQILVTFSGGSVYEQIGSASLLTANANSGQAVIAVANSALFQVGDRVRVYDNLATEWNTISSIDSPTQITLGTNLANNYTTANAASIIEVERTELETGRIYATVSLDVPNFATIAEGTFTTSSTTVPADTGRTEVDDYFNGSWIIPITGDSAFQPRLIVDFANTGGVFTLDPQQPFTTLPGLVRYIIVAPNSQLAPATDATSNNTPAHVVGSKADTADYTYNATTSSLVRLVKGALGVQVIGEGTLTTSSATVPADTGRTEANDYWNGSWIMTVTGATAFQPRLIADFANAGGVFTLDAQQPLTAVPGTVAYVILSPNSQLVPSADATSNQTPAHVVGNKADVAVWAASTTASVIAYLKGVLGTSVLASGTLTTSSATVPADTARAEVNDYWNGSWLMPVSGATAFQPRLITDFANTGGVFTLDAQQPLTGVPGLVAYVILSPNSQLVPSADAATNTTPAHVTGNKTDSIPAMNAAPGNDSIVAHVKAILERVGATPADPDDSLLTNIGQRDDTATADDLSDVTTTSIEAKLRRLLLRFSSNAFSSTVQGVARTDVEAMVSALATYLSASGAAWSVTANPGGSARDNLEQTLEDFSDVLAGSTGIVTYPVGAAPGDGVSIAEVLRWVAQGVVVANGTFTTSSATVPADTGRTEANDYWNGCYLLPLSGSVAFQPRLITDFANAGGVFTVDAQQPFTAATGTVTYAIISAQIPLVPAADATTNTTAAHVIGNKSDAASVTAGQASIVALLRTLIGSGVNSPQQVFEKTITSAANAGNVTLATVGTQPVIIDSIVEMAVTAQTGDLTTAAVYGGAANAVTFIPTSIATQANLNAIDEQLSFTGAVRLSVGKTIIVDLLGTGATATDLKFVITYHPVAVGGVLS